MMLRQEKRYETILFVLARQAGSPQAQSLARGPSFPSGKRRSCDVWLGGGHGPFLLPALASGGMTRPNTLNSGGFMVLSLPEGSLVLNPADALSLAKLMDSIIEHSADEKEIQLASTYEGLFLSLAWIGAFQWHVTPQTEEEVQSFINKGGHYCPVKKPGKYC
jgi:hypothetical protein